MEQNADAQAVKKLSGVERSALLMLGLGEKHAAEILRHMGPKEVQEIGLAMASLSNVTNSQMELVMQKFVDAIGEQTSLGM
ncbi:MAG: flagellar motor switch protein FliG, partial [Gammaproteobacteria bacterium]|nr:flagellar motor switch protein FliG [Gammaproteobacteria bacterium]